jgi:plasmid stabilization system protein ParE
MKLRWTSKALSDLERLHEFLRQVNAQAASRTVGALASAPEKLLTNPRIGERLAEFGEREVRRILVKRYEIRYEIKDSSIYVLRIWHTKEYR